MFIRWWFALFLFIVAASCGAIAAPKITELMAAGQAVVADEDGLFPDWIEIHNPDATEIDLSGWRLSDDAGKPAKWVFPSVVLPAGGYLVVFCSEKVRSGAGGELHTNFRLDAGGELLQLRNPAGEIAHELRFPLQIPDLSFDGADFLNAPTPGAANSSSTVAVVRAPEFSAPHGFYERAFSLELTCATAGAEIRYTLDGSEPVSTSPRYTAPLRVTKTSCVRAAGFAAGKRQSPTVTQTYLFVADIVKQSPAGQAPKGWPKTWGANRVDYGMDPRIAQRGNDAKALPGALKAIPSISVVMPLPDLFDPAIGIYANADQKGRDWERPMSMEVIYPDGSAGVQVNAGLRIRGGASRGSDNPKHNFRVLFRKEYGAEALEFPLFGPDGAQRSERFDLRCEQLVGWVAFPDETADFIRDIYGRDTQGALGQPAKRGDFYHLYINGQYWGLYQTDERVGAEYAAEHFGGKEEDYDTVKINYDHDSTGGGTDFIDGSFGAWRRAVSLGHEGFESNENYFRVQGMNADGSRDKGREPLIDVDNLIDYMLAGIYIAADDSPPAFGTQNNWYGVRSRKGDFGFRFFAHDWEISMQDGSGLDNRVGEHPAENPFRSLGGGPIFLREPVPGDGDEEEFRLDPTSANPWHFWQAMRQNAEFRLRVADHVQRHFFNDGALTQEKAVARWRARMEEIDQAVIGESARWGDGRQNDGFPGPFFAEALEQRRAAGEQPRLIQLGAGQDEDDVVAQDAKAELGPRPPPAPSVKRKLKPYTRATWLKACQEHILDGFLANRSANVLEHLRLGQLFPVTPAPLIAPFGGPLAPGETVQITPPLIGFNGTFPPIGVWPIALPENLTAIFGAVYYTTNGSDPRLVGGAVSPEARAYAEPLRFAKKTTLKARAFNPLSKEWSALVEATFLPNTDFGGLKITEIHYQPPSPIGGDGEFLELQNTGATALDVSGFKIAGEISYTFPAGTVIEPGAYYVLGRSAALFATLYPGAPLHGLFTRRLGDNGGQITIETAEGGRVLSVKYDDEGEWPAAADGFGFSLVYDGKGDQDEAKNWRASAALHGSPGAADPGWNGGVPVVISKAGFGASGPFIEIANVSADQTIDTGASWLVHGSQRFSFPSGSLAPGESRSYHLSELNSPPLAIDGGEVAFQLGMALGGAEAVPLGAVHRFRFGPLLEGMIYGRVIVSDGREFFPQIEELSGEPVTSSTRIEEIHYQPSGGSEPEFVELVNHSLTAADLAGARLEGLAFEFPAGAEIPPQGRALVVTVAPETFREQFDVPGDVPIFGPAAGSLQDNGEAVALLELIDADGGPAYRVVEELRYNERAPWPVAAAGRGHSLQRLSGVNYSAEPASWGSALPSPGVMNAVNGAPVVTLVSGSVAHEFVANAFDRDGAVEKLEFIVDGTVVEEIAGGAATFAYRATTGVHDVWVRATDDRGGTALSANITLDASGVPAGAGLGLRAEFFPNTNFEGDPSIVKSVTEIGGDWFHLDPAPGISRTGFSARYSGKLVPRANGLHRFVFETTGGLRVFLDGELVIDEWADPQTGVAVPFFHEAELIGGKAVDFVIEYFDDDGFASLRVRWSEAGSFLEGAILPELLYLPGQDPAAVAIAVPGGIARRFLGQAVNAKFALLNAPEGTATWSVIAGALPPGLTLSANGTLTGKPSIAGEFDFTVAAATSEPTAIAPRSARMRVVDRGVPAPTVRVLQPGAKVASAANVVARGTAASPRPIARIRYSLNSGAWHELPGGNEWSVELSPSLGLAGGDNVLSVQAEDDEGRVSSIVDRHFVRQYPAPLFVTVNGAGKVTPGFLGRSMRVVGQPYTITATPAPGYLFAGWEGFGFERTITFGMTEGLALTANFVPNPFVGTKGLYTAFIGETEKNHRQRGRATLSLTNQGDFTGTIDFAAARYAIKGALDPQGNATVFPGDPATGRFISAALAFDVETRDFTIEVNVWDGETSFSSAGVFSPVPWTPQQRCPDRGRWNMILPVDDVPPPRGTGLVGVTVSPRGMARAKVTMPDGRSLAVSGHVNTDGGLALYAPLGYDPATTAGESFSGVLNFNAGEGLAAGELVWAGGRDGEVIPKLEGAALPADEDSFAHTLAASGSRYVAPIAGLPALELPSAVLVVRNASGDVILSRAASLDGGSVFRFTSPDANQAELRISRRDGLVTGSALLPAPSGHARGSFTGLADQGGVRVGGQYLDAQGNVGSFEVLPAP